MAFSPSTRYQSEQIKITKETSRRGDTDHRLGTLHQNTSQREIGKIPCPGFPITDPAFSHTSRGRKYEGRVGEKGSRASLPKDGRNTRMRKKSNNWLLNPDYRCMGRKFWVTQPKRTDTSGSSAVI